MRPCPHGGHPTGTESPSSSTGLPTLHPRHPEFPGHRWPGISLTQNAVDSDGRLNMREAG